MPPPGCPGEPKDTTTLTVPNSGITTPADAIEGLENKAWVLGHSRWAGVNQLLYVLQDINLGDEVIIDGVDRMTGEALAGQRFVVDAIYLTDIDSGETLINAAGPQDIPREPTVISQTSVREQSTTMDPQPPEGDIEGPEPRRGQPGRPLQVPAALRLRHRGITEASKHAHRVPRCSCRFSTCLNHLGTTAKRTSV